MTIPFQNPEKLIDKIIADLELDISGNQEKELRKNLENIYIGRMYDLIQSLSNGAELPKTGMQDFIDFIGNLPNLQKEIEFEAIKFYEEMTQIPDIVKTYQSNQ